jgi:hypothetical protein
MHKKLQHTDVLINSIIYKQNCTFKIQTILFLHLGVAMTKCGNWYKIIYVITKNYK